MRTVRNTTASIRLLFLNFFAIIAYKSTRSYGKKCLFQIGVLHNFLAPGNEIGEGLAFEHAVGQQGQVYNLVQHLIAAGKCFNIGTVCLANSLAGFAGLGLFLLGSVGRGFGGQFGAAQIFATSGFSMFTVML